jgi:glycosyltransferase involved in cell wall biosynthesis
MAAVPALIPRTVVHYSKNDPRTYRGGVESFARNLGLVFERVEFMTPGNIDLARVKRERLPVICDNHMVLHWPRDMTVIGFQHGVVARKLPIVRSWYDLKLTIGQYRARKRPNVIWVACARWIAAEFNKVTLCPSQRIIYHPVDLNRFDGKLQNAGSKLVLHDGRSAHKGQHLFELLSRRLPQYRFETLGCPPEQVPDRMRSALAFLHLSRYEGNSIVCNEAMAMNLPCLFTRVGLMLDEGQDFDVSTIEPELAFNDPEALVTTVARFLEQAERQPRNPRAWVAEHASAEATRAGWLEVMAAFDAETGRSR